MAFFKILSLKIFFSLQNEDFVPKHTFLLYFSHLEPLCFAFANGPKIPPC